ncbi:MAG: FtsX-like permease family protein [Rikenellaceae bacterium]|nr:FtsX-like permease family protein [Rikenellaceae bacterium]MDE7356478.1 FtsX-like permease family protein [Rikenellaceae bacterium]
MLLRGVPYISLRYLFSGKSHSIINIISVLSALAVTVPCAAMIVLLSVYNGLDDVLRSMYGHFDPQLKISSVTGRYFNVSEGLQDSLRSVEGVDVVSPMIDENVFAAYDDRNTIVTMRGVDSSYARLVPIEQMMIAGRYSPVLGDIDRAVAGAGIVYKLGVNIAMRRKIELYTYNAPTRASFMPSSFYRKKGLQPVGIYQLDADTDSRYLLVPLRFAGDLLGKEGKATSIGLKLDSEADERAVQERVAQLMGPHFKVQNRFEQKETIFRIMGYEKIGIFFIIFMVAAISSLTLVASVVMLVSDKEGQLQTLKSMGATDGYIRRIFFVQGVMISALGLVAGVALGLGLAFVQQRWGVIGIGGGSLIIDTYPVRIALSDVVLTVVSMALLNVAITYSTSKGVIRTIR